MKFPQLVQLSAHPRPVSALFLDDSLARIPIADLKEIRRLSRFLPLVVLIPKSHVVKAHGAPAKFAASRSLSQISKSARVLGPSGKAVKQIQKHKHEERVSLGDARASFTTKDMIRNERRVISCDDC